MMRSFLAGLVVLALTASAPISTSARADNWPQWRGPHNNGVCDEKNLPTKFDKAMNLVWRLPLPGPAGSTPVVWGDRIYLTSPEKDTLPRQKAGQPRAPRGRGGRRNQAEQQDLLLMCVSADGHELWRHAVGHSNRNVMGDEGNLCSPSPVTDGKHVWTLMGTGDLACYDPEGKQTWAVDLQARYGKFQYQYGLASTPLLDGDRLYLQVIHGDGDASTHEQFVVALDKATGKEIWKQTRISDGYQENEHSYASPMMYDDGKVRLLITHGNDYIVAHRLDTGEEVWRCGGINPKSHYNQFLRLVASPAIEDGVIIVPSAKRGPVIAVRGTGKGDITDSKDFQLWKRDRGTPDVPSPLIHDGLVYLAGENGDLTVVDAKDGKEIYRKQTVRVRHRASPVYGDGKIYLASREGEVSVIQAGREFKVLEKNELGEPIAASPAISNGRIYLRTYDALWAVGKK
ncbi:MAG TPA: PQQ-binding-like beta-propeller repeat protein [Planctomycetaceae bacterium]|jgi:outer membrane protein assembly factor BamB|nr:PQQ-binding-like beta-propeller repeat protein [Planctomycetaceae bacterium]